MHSSSTSGRVTYEWGMYDAFTRMLVQVLWKCITDYTMKQLHVTANQRKCNECYYVYKTYYEHTLNVFLKTYQIHTRPYVDRRLIGISTD